MNIEPVNKLNQPILQQLEQLSQKDLLQNKKDISIAASSITSNYFNLDVSQKENFLAILENNSLMCYLLLRSMVLTIPNLSFKKANDDLKSLLIEHSDRHNGNEDIEKRVYELFQLCQTLYSSLSLFKIITALLNNKEEYVIFLHFYFEFIPKLLKAEDFLRKNNILYTKQFATDVIFSNEYISTQTIAFIDSFIEYLTNYKKINCEEDLRIIEYCRDFLSHGAMKGFLEKYSIIEKICMKISEGTEEVRLNYLAILEIGGLYEKKIIVLILCSFEKMDSNNLPKDSLCEADTLIKIKENIYNFLKLYENNKLTELAKEVILDYQASINIRIILLRILQETLQALTMIDVFEELIIHLVDVIKIKQNIKVLGYSSTKNNIYVLCYIIKLCGKETAKKLIDSKRHSKFVQAFLECSETNIRRIGTALLQIIHSKAGNDLDLGAENIPCDNESKELISFYDKFCFESITRRKPSNKHSVLPSINFENTNDSESENEYSTLHDQKTTKERYLYLNEIINLLKNYESNEDEDQIAKCINSLEENLKNTDYAIINDYGDNLAQKLVSLNIELDQKTEIERLKAISYIIQINAKIAKNLITLLFEANLNLSQKCLILSSIIHSVKSKTYTETCSSKSSNDKIFQSLENADDFLIKEHKINWISHRLVEKETRLIPIGDDLVSMYFEPLFNGFCKNSKSLKGSINTVLIDMILDGLTLITVKACNCVSFETISSKFALLIKTIRSITQETSTAKTIIKSYIMLYDLACKVNRGGFREMLLKEFRDIFSHFEETYKSTNDSETQSLCLNLFSVMLKFREETFEN